MTAGRGFLALAIMIFGAWRPSAPSPPRSSSASPRVGVPATGEQRGEPPQQFVNLLPYVLTLVVLAVFAGRVRPPAAAGQPFVKGED